MNKPIPSRIHRTHRDNPVASAQMDQGLPPGLPPLSELPGHTRPFYGKPMTEEFVKNFLGNKAVVDAYYHPKVIAGVASAGDPAQRSDLPTLIPMAMAMRAASRAAAMELIKPHERPLVHLATMVYPCGLFFCAYLDDPHALAVGPQFHEVALMRSMLLELPLKKLKGRHTAMGNTLAAVLGLAHSAEDVDLEQVSRLATAVHLANARITTLWAPPEPAA
ncbi:hypothetical protein [Polaromonas sp. JS666]|uniref:hypothetical protein n=1 Tax=Polaromonas sp. (strain JS666 / ATCC BAA-500) TaxID=296591 RepID=UPI0002F667A2|nr:hypothetical protein [Polaromonas sp. JS666]